MAEDFNDFGSYRRQLEDEEFQSRPLIRKIFSLRALKFALKMFGYFLVFMVFAVLLWRIFSSKLPSAASKVIWTKNSYAAYEQLGDDLLIYTQDVGTVYDKDGKFSLYEFHYIPAANEVQFTVRFNQSTIDKLAEELTEEKRKEMGEAFTEADAITDEMLGDMPFAFVVRDDFGNVYTAYEYTTFTKNRYTYVRVAFSGIDLYDIEKGTPTVNYPIPESPNPDYIYKGELKGEYVKSPTQTLHFDVFFVDTFAEFGADSEKSFIKAPMVLYRSERPTESYRFDKPKSASSLTTFTPAAVLPEEQ
ncbi:MAG: hypothetical protein IJW21_05830 [Clostridia bacterium]|nr:hypothetical protein [Clostridia bacterium]